MYDLFFITDNQTYWHSVKSCFPHAKRMPKSDDYISRCASAAFTRMLWIVPEQLSFDDSWNFSFMPEGDEQNYLHLWSARHPRTADAVDGCIQLWPRKLAKTTMNFDLTSLPANIKTHDEQTSTYADQFDIFFVSYLEPNADENFKRLQARFPMAKRVHGIKGIDLAHRTCAEQSTTSMFWTVDGDTTIDETWHFDHVPSRYDRNYIHIWHSRNPINSLEYGYGAVKLWPAAKVLAYNGRWLDFTTSVGQIKILDQTIATTHFNSSPFETWKSAFRECVKLLRNLEINPDDMESQNRLNSWTNTESNAQHADWCRRGSRDSVDWYLNNHGNFSKINDFDFLSIMFNELEK